MAGVIALAGAVPDPKTIDGAAAQLDGTVDRIFDLAIDMETKSAVIWVYGPGDNSVTAYSPFGIKNLRELIKMYRKHARRPHRILTYD